MSNGTRPRLSLLFRSMEASQRKHLSRRPECHPPSFAGPQTAPASHMQSTPAAFQHSGFNRSPEDRGGESQSSRESGSSSSIGHGMGEPSSAREALPLAMRL